MKARAHFEEAGDAAFEFNLAFARFGDAAQEFEQRGFARAVSADDAHGLALLDFKRNVIQRPKFLARVGIARRAAFEQRAEFVHKDVAQSYITVSTLPRLVPEDVFFTEVFDADGGAHSPFFNISQITPGESGQKPSA